MKNVTVSMDENTLRRLRVRAAEEGKSVSRYLAEMVEERLAASRAVGPVDRNAQIDALEQILSGPKWSVLRDGKMPSADERNER